MVENFEVRFLAMEYYLGVLNRTFEISIDGSGLHGAIVNYLMSTNNPRIFKARHTGNAYDLLSTSVIARARRHPAGSEPFLKLSRFNFSFGKGAISKISYNPKRKWGMGTVPHSGRLFVTTSDGLQRELIVLGKPDIPKLIADIETIGITVDWA